MQAHQKSTRICHIWTLWQWALECMTHTDASHQEEKYDAQCLKIHQKSLILQHCEPRLFLRIFEFFFLKRSEIQMRHFCRFSNPMHKYSFAKVVEDSDAKN